ncbi:MAG: hypothetical protein ABSH47_24405 [Bryobacteraceae bacterium]
MDPVLAWVRFMDFEEAERYRIEVQQTWARSLGFFGRFVARHYSWFLALFKRLGWFRISLVLLACLVALLSRIGVWEKSTIIEMAVALSAVGGALLWCYFLASAMATNWKRVEYRNFRKRFVPAELHTIAVDLEPILPSNARLIVEYFGRTFLIGVVQSRHEVRYFGCWSGRSNRRSRLLFPRES